MATIHILALIAKQGRDAFLRKSLAVAKAVGLPTTSWRVGDPTLTVLQNEAEVNDVLEDVVIEYAKASNLSTAEEGDWLDLHAEDTYGVPPAAATYAHPTITLRNDGGAVYPLEVGDLTVKSTASDKTYHNTARGRTPGDVETLVLGPGVTLTFDLEADEAGSASSVIANDLDELVTTLEGVVIVGSTAGAASDKPSGAEIKEQCRSTLGALSPNGPPDAYEYVCRNSTLTGGTEITRASAEGDNTTGNVSVFVAGAAGAVTSTSVEQAQRACELWATPLAIKCTVASAVNQSIDVHVIVSGADIPAGWEARVRGAIEALFRALDIGEDVPTSKIIEAVHQSIKEIRSVQLVAPAGLTVIVAADGVPVIGAFIGERT
jgi:Baseplate J-like protein